MILSADGNAILRQWKLKNPNSDLPSMDELINFAFERAEAEYQTIAKDDYEKPDVDEPDLGQFSNTNLYNNLYETTEGIQGGHNITSPISVGTATSPIKTAVNLSGKIFIPGKQDDLIKLLGTTEGEKISGKELDIVVNNIGIKRTAVKNGKEIYLTSEQEQLPASELKKLGITPGEWVQVAIGTLTPTVGGEDDPVVSDVLSQNGILPEDGTGGSTTVVIPIGKVAGKLPKDDGYVFNVLDKIQNQRNSATKSSGGGSYDNI